MKVNVTNKIPTKLRKHISNITKFTVDTIFTKRQQAKLQSISIRLDRNLDKSSDDESVGLAYMDIREDDNFDKPTNFVIWINPFFTKKNLSRFTKTTFAETIIHEIVHIRQCISGQMKQIYKNGNMVIKFQKKIYKINSKNDYWLFPWEIEARGHEKGVLNLYCAQYEAYKQFPDIPMK